MNWIIKSTTGALDAAQDRFRRSRLRLGRRGSVLIIVIGLLVLMAIIGTAYISTARVDRTAAAANAENTEAVLQLQGLQDMITAQIINDINPYVTSQTVNGTASTINATRFRSGVVTSTPAYAPYNSPIIDQWLSSRIPVTLDTTQAVNYSVGSTYNPPVWRFLGYPLAGPFTDPTSTTGATYGSAPTTAGAGVYLPVSETYNSTLYPALEVYNPANNSFTGPYMAADTDGDGIADAGLFRMPGGEINGVTYFGALRVIDNSAAINTSIAWAPQQITQTPAAPGYVTWANGASQQPLPGNFWPTNVDLADFVPDSLSNLNTYRFGTTTPSGTPTEGSGLSFAYIAGYPTGNNYDTVWNELGRRLQNPYTGYLALTQADSAAMAHRFVVRDPNASESNIETYLPESTYNNAPTTAYVASDVSDWFNNNFIYNIGSQASTANLRSLLTAYNPVSCFSPSKYGPTGGTPAAAYNANANYTFGDWVNYNNHAYVCIAPNGPGVGGVGAELPGTSYLSTITGINYTNTTGYYADTLYWCYEPWSNAPVKTNVNTGTFAQLWLAYWNVMCDGQNQAPNQASSETAVSSTGAMFRSSLRSSTGAPGPAVGAALSATQELQLRAAIASANALALRAANTNYTTTQIAPIYDYTSNPPAVEYTAVIAGNAPQPYITEVYADNDPAVGDGSTGYIAIEVYNPYPYNLNLTGWALATVSRPNTPGANITPTVIPTTSTTWNTNGPIIPANGYAVIANTGQAVPTDFTTGPVATTANAPPTTASPTAAKPPLYVVTDLSQAFNNDLVLVRPPPGTATSSGQPTNITGFFPVDSYDFTGLQPQTTGNFQAANTYEWHYARPNAQPWQFVYPGPFDQTLGANGSEPRFKCTQVGAYPPGASSGSTPPLNAGSVATLGVADASGTTGTYGATPGTFPSSAAPTPLNIQVDNIDFGGPIKVSASQTNYFPFGQFPRNGDILQVPFIGSYLIYRGAVAPADLVEMNPITLDSAYAASTGGDQTVSLAGAYLTQNIGRFVPYWNVDYSTTNPTGTGTVYGWCTRLFEYLTVQAPGDDYLPNTDPVQYQQVTGKLALRTANAKPSVTNALATQTVSEDTVPVQGLININTAPWRVLATLPFSDDPNTNAALAQAIVNYRDGYYSQTLGTFVVGHGPFANIFDLNNAVSQFNNTQTGLSTSAVPNIAFNTTLGSYNNSGIYADAFNWLGPSHPPSNNDGLLTPLYSTFNQAYPGVTPYVPTSDFQEQNLALARVSNLITTRSDSYTVYLLIQGWTNAGTASAKMVVQRRAAFIVDRSGTTPSNPTVKISNVSTN